MFQKLLQKFKKDILLQNPFGYLNPFHAVLKMDEDLHDIFKTTEYIQYAR